MRITQAHFVAGYSAFYFDDQKAIKNGAGQDGFTYVGNAVTDGFREIRQAVPVNTRTTVVLQTFYENRALLRADGAAL